MNGEYIMEVIGDLELCDVETGVYYRVLAVQEESTGLMIQIEPV